MRKLTLLSFLAITFLSCSSDSQEITKPNEGDEKLTKFTLNTSIWSEDFEPIKTKSTPADYYPEDINELRNGVQWIEYFIYNADNGDFIKLSSGPNVVDNPVSPSSCKPIQDSLPKGNYHIAIVGKQRLEVVGIDNPFTNLNDAYIVKNYGHYYCALLELSVGDAPIVKDIFLKRITGELEVFLLDAKDIFSNNMERFDVSMHEPKRLSLADGKWYDITRVYGAASSFDIVALSKSYNIPIPYCIYPDEVGLVFASNNHIPELERGYLDIEISYITGTHGSGGNMGEIVTRTIKAPTIYPNTITRLKGKFKETENLDFDIEYENEIGEIVEEEF